MRPNHILIIDDDPSNILLLEEILTDPANTVRGLNDPRLAEDVVLEFSPDIILLDLHMPELDGLEVLQRLSGVRSRSYIPTVMLTADDSRLARQSALVLGATDFLTKPFDVTEVRLRVRNLLHTRNLYVELEEAQVALQRHSKETA